MTWCVQCSKSGTKAKFEGFMEKSKGILNVSSLKLTEKTKALKEKWVGVYISLESYQPWINVYRITVYYP